MAKTLIVLKVAFALLAASAIVTELAVLGERNQLVTGNFFSFFTIQSNILAVVSLLVGAFVLASSRSSQVADYFRGATALYLVMTGVIFSVLLADLDPSVLTAVPWDNVVLHYIIPIVMLADWALDPPSTKLRFSRALLWMLYPLTYGVYTLVRGSVVGWYPYPFLNPETNGYGSIAVVSVIILVAVIVFAWLLVKVPNVTRFSK